MRREKPHIAASLGRSGARYTKLLILVDGHYQSKNL
jgi:hypothetical protein